MDAPRRLSSTPAFFVLLLACVLHAAPIRADEPPCCEHCEAADEKPTDPPDGSLLRCPRAKWPVLHKRGLLSTTGSFEIAAAPLFSLGSWFGNAPTVVGGRNDLSWADGFFEAGIDVTRRAQAGAGALYGRASVIGDAAVGTNPNGETDRRSLAMEDYYLGWRSGSRIGRPGSKAFDVSVGGREFHVGRGMLLWDGGLNGGAVGDAYLAPRTAFEFTGTARLDTGRWLADAFFLVPHRLRRSGTRATLAGVNLERRLECASRLGISYIHVVDSNAASRSGLNVIDIRARGCPFRRAPGLDAAAELALQFRGNSRRALGGYGEIGHRWCRHGGRPRLSYRLAWFSGDNPRTARNEAFDALYYGGNVLDGWTQGVVLGNFVTQNTNLITHRLQFTIEASSRLNLAAIAWLNRLDRPGSYQPVAGRSPPTSSRLASEFDLLATWTPCDRFTLGAQLGVAFPQAAARQAFGGDDPWFLAALTVSYDL